MRFVIRAVCRTTDRLATVATPNSAIRALLGNNTACVIVSELSAIFINDHAFRCTDLDAALPSIQIQA